VTMSALETRVGDVLATFSTDTGADGILVTTFDAPVLATPVALAGAFAGGVAWGSAMVAAFEAGRAVRGG